MKSTLLICLLVFGMTSFAQKIAASEYAQTTKIPPYFMGGDTVFYSYLDQHKKLPAGFDAAAYLKENHNQFEPIATSFTIDIHASIVDVKIMEKTNPLLDKKAKEIVANMPKWVSGTLDGKPVKEQYAIPVRFNLM